MAEQAARLTGGVPLLAVIDKGRRAFVARGPCRACRVGLVVTGPYRGAAGGDAGAVTDYYVRCANCGEMEMLSLNRLL